MDAKAVYGEYEVRDPNNMSTETDCLPNRRLFPLRYGKEIQTNFLTVLFHAIQETKRSL